MNKKDMSQKFWWINWLVCTIIIKKKSMLSILNIPFLYILAEFFFIFIVRINDLIIIIEGTFYKYVNFIWHILNQLIDLTLL